MIPASPLHLQCYHRGPCDQYLLLLLLQQPPNFSTLPPVTFETVTRILSLLPQPSQCKPRVITLTYFPRFSFPLTLTHSTWAILASLPSLDISGMLLPQDLCTGYFLCQKYSFPDTHMTNFLASFKSLLKYHLLNDTLKTSSKLSSHTLQHV